MILDVNIAIQIFRHKHQRQSSVLNDCTSFMIPGVELVRVHGGIQFEDVALQFHTTHGNGHHFQIGRIFSHHCIIRSSRSHSRDTSECALMVSGKRTHNSAANKRFLAALDTFVSKFAPIRSQIAVSSGNVVHKMRRSQRASVLRSPSESSLCKNVHLTPVDCITDQ